MRPTQSTESTPRQLPPEHSLDYYVGRIEAFHAVLDLTAPWQPRFGELKLSEEDCLDLWVAAMYNAHRSLGSALSRLTMEQREVLREATMDLSRNPPTHPYIADPQNPIYRFARSVAYREIIAALEIRTRAPDWVM